MSNEVSEKKEIALPQVKKILQSIGDENLDQFQRRTFDYVSKFSKIDADSADRIVDTLITEFGLDGYGAIQIINCMPKSIEELRTFLGSGRKIIETTKLEAILTLLNKHKNIK